MKEYTAIGYDDNGKCCEIMINVNDKGEILRVYTYRDSVPHIYNYETEKIINVTQKPTQNSLFVNIYTRSKNIIHYLNERGFIIGDEEEETNDETFGKFLQKYNVQFN